MKNFKRFGAILGIVLILAVFCVPMILAFGSGENSRAAFQASLAAAIVFPILLYAFGMAYKIFGKKKPNEEKEIENIIFDIGNVLVKFDWEAYLKSFGFSEEKNEKIADAVFRSQIWNERDRGTLAEEEYVNQMAASVPEYETDIREVMRRSPEAVTAFDYGEIWVRYLKEKGYKLYILSNYGHYMRDRNKDAMPFLKYMDGVVFSCDVNMIKPEAEIYQTILARYNLNPEKSLFIDDREENCAAARKEGIKTIRFQNFKQTAKELEKLGVV